MVLGEYCEKGFDVPDPHDNSNFGDPNTTNNIWDYWYGDLMNARSNRNVQPVGYTSQVWNYPAPSVEF